MRPEADENDQTAADYLDHALEDLAQARQQARAETKAVIDSAVQHTREALQDLGGHAKKLRTKHQEQTWDWQRKLQYASDDLLLELGIEAVRAQRTSLALDALAKEIKRRKQELPWGA